jgi:hypothetical protein
VFFEQKFVYCQVVCLTRDSIKQTFVAHFQYCPYNLRNMVGLQ